MEFTYTIDDNGIYIHHEVLGENVYRLIMTKEMFIEAYNKYIRDDTSSNSNKEFIG